MADHSKFDTTIFLDHYREHYALSGRPFSDYKAAYQFGWDKACEGAYRGHEWGDPVERTLRTEWQHSDPDLRWEDVHNAICEGYLQGHGSMLK